MRIILLIFVSLFILKAEYIRDNTLEVVLDTSANLMWEDSIDTNSTRLTWVNSINYCENLNFAGYTDWHLPNRNELFSLRDTSRNIAPTINSEFKYVVNYTYWSSTDYTIDSNNDNALLIDFDIDFGGRGLSKTGEHNVRCVRIID